MITSAPAQPKAPQRTLVGRVISNKMDKTVTVLIERRVRHPVYGKYLVRSTKLHAHDASDSVGEGDLVPADLIPPVRSPVQRDHRQITGFPGRLGPARVQQPCEGERH